MNIEYSYPKESHPNYTIYLLTIWASEAGNASDPAAWRFRLENPRTKERKGFVGVEALIAGLVQVVQGDAERPDAPVLAPDGDEV